MNEKQESCGTNNPAIDIVFDIKNTHSVNVTANDMIKREWRECVTYSGTRPFVDSDFNRLLKHSSVACCFPGKYVNWSSFREKKE